MLSYVFVHPYPLAPYCAKCGIKNGNLNCCFNGGSWESKCGKKPKKFTWSQGLKACEGSKTTRNHFSIRKYTSKVAQSRRTRADHCLFFLIGFAMFYHHQLLPPHCVLPFWCVLLCSTASCSKFACCCADVRENHVAGTTPAKPRAYTFVVKRISKRIGFRFSRTENPLTSPYS